jgi:hypothetical protein
MEYNRTSAHTLFSLCLLADQASCYQSNIGRPPYATQYFSARFYCALITLHVSSPFGGHLQVVHKYKKYIQGCHLLSLFRVSMLLVIVFVLCPADFHLDNRPEVDMSYSASVPLGLLDLFYGT